jgi:flavin reductase (DIM6/NTAB) family NADH-FMN oxidoreductase RutF
MQVTDKPKRILFALENSTYTASLLHVGAKCCVSVLAEDTPFPFFRLFGYSSGRNVQKLNEQNSARASNGACYPTDHTVAIIAATVHASIPCGTHTVYLADVCEARVLSGKHQLTYEHYQNRIKKRV